jgi:hypothetical protein
VPDLRLPDRKILWGRSGYRCAFPGCGIALAEEAPESGRNVIVSQECHIVAASDGGPRGDSSIPDAERDSYSNRILLCLRHHRIIDDDPETYTADRLRAMKAGHEQRVWEALEPADRRQLDDEIIYAEITAGWADRVGLQTWEAWTSGPVAAHPAISHEDFERLRALSAWLLNRPWPRRLATLEAGFQNFRRVLDDLLMVLGCATVDRDDDRLIDVFYKAQHFEESVYYRLLEQYRWIEDMIHDLTFELTRAANLVNSEVREHLDRRFRVDEGDTSIVRQANLMMYRYVPRYSEAELATATPYDTLEDFATTRATRDVYFGDGFHPDAFHRVTPLQFRDDG